MAPWTKEEKAEVIAGCTGKFVQLVDRVLYDIRMQVINDSEAGGIFMAAITPLMKDAKSTAKDYASKEPGILDLVITRSIVPALATTLRKVRDGDGLYNTQAEINASSRRVQAQILASAGVKPQEDTNGTGSDEPEGEPLPF